MNKQGVVNPRDPNAFRCCFCCHVKVGTIIYGLFCLMVDLLALGFVVLLSIHPDILVPSQAQYGKPGSAPEFDGIRIDALEKELANAREVLRPLTREDLCMAYVVTFLFIMAAIGLLYGVIRSRPSYIIPFFCIHVFFFCMSCLTLVSYFTYAPHFNVKMWMRDSGMDKMPGMEHMMEVDSDYLMFFALTMLILALCVKAYIIGMIWSCYKYVQHVAYARTTTREYRVDPDTEMLLPPRYEDAIKTEGNTTQPPPPPYCQ